MLDLDPGVAVQVMWLICCCKNRNKVISITHIYSWFSLDVQF
jgi:hypothetical protein